MSKQGEAVIATVSPGADRQRAHLRPQVVEHAAVGDHRPLGLAGRAGGVEDVGEIVRLRTHRCRRGRGRLAQVDEIAGGRPRRRRQVGERGVEPLAQAGAGQGRETPAPASTRAVRRGGCAGSSGR